MEPHVWRLHTLIPCISLTDLRHIIHRLRSSHIAILHDGIVVVLRLSQFQHIGCHLTPTMVVLTVTFGKCHRIADMVRTTVITCQHEVRAFKMVADISKRALQLCYIFRRSRDICLFASGSYRRLRDTPRWSAVPGMICIRPFAPANDTALGSNVDS